jgi:hypothetical protein
VVRVRPPFVRIRSKSRAIIVCRANVSQPGDSLLVRATLIYIELGLGILKWGGRGGIIELIAGVERSDLKRLGYLALGTDDIDLCLKDVNFWSTTGYTDGRARVIGSWASAGRETLPRKIRETRYGWLAALGLIR